MCFSVDFCMDSLHILLHFVQSSCTRYDMEAQGTHRKLELKLPIEPGATMDQSGQNIQMRNIFTNDSAAKGSHSYFIKLFS